MLRLRSVGIILCGLLAAGLCHATDVAYSGVFQGTEGPAKATAQSLAATYTRDMNTTGDRVSVQVVSSSYVATSQTFTDGSVSTGTITVSSNSYIQASTPTLTINGVNIAYTPQSSANATALNIAATINSSSLGSTLISTNTANVVYSTSIAAGVAYNYAMTTSSQAALGVSNVTMNGGVNPSYTINTPTITIPSNGFVTGLAVLYSSSTAVAITGLTNQATYYVSIVNPNTLGQSSTFKLATTSTGAVAGTGVVLASSQTVTPGDTFTLAPLAFTNTNGGGIQLQWSDDKVTFFNATTGNWAASISSVTFASGGATALWDLGPTQHRYLRLKETPPTTGAATYTVTDNERYSAIH